jgi:dTDP-glucose 4,6-dehydratase
MVGADQRLIESVPDRDNYDLRYLMTAAKAKAALGWEAQYDFDRTLEATVGWYVENPAWLTEAQAKMEGLHG